MRVLFYLLFSCCASAAAPARVLVASYSGIITPVASEYLKGSLGQAEKLRYDAVVILLDTPGGLDLAMRDIVKAILASSVPVIVYVSPAGARAASAGVFITMAAHVAVMARGTNIGAAHPVAIAGGLTPGKEQKNDPVMERKMTSDAGAYLQAIAAKRGRSARWALAAVSQSTSATSGEAVRQNVVDFEADSLAEVLAKADGLKLAGFSAPLRTKGASIERVEMTRRQRILAAVSDPNIAMVMMTLGVSGLLIELYSPGLILPGIVGGSSLILAFYSFQTLSASHAGIAMIFLGLILFLLEIKTASFGLLALTGTLSLLFGSLMLFQETGDLAISRGVIAGAVGTMVVLMAALLALVRQTFGRRPSLGAETLKGATAVAVSALNPTGTVRLDDELWKAKSLEGSIAQGSEVEIVAARGLVLEVRRRHE